MLREVLLASAGLLGVGAAVAQTAPAQKEAPDLAAAFGARPDVESMSLSPDGNKVAIISPREREARS